MIESEKRLETWDDIRNRFDDILKKPVDGRNWHRNILERYKNGDLSLHFHFTGGECGGRCLEVKHHFATPASPSDELASLKGSRIVIPCRSDCEQGQAMLVLVYEIAHGSHQFAPSVIRLNIFDDGYCRRWDSPIVRQISKTIRWASTIGDWEADSTINSDLRAAIDGGQLPSNIVEAGPEISEAVANNQAEFKRRLDRDDGGTDDSLLVVLLERDFVRVGIQVSADLTFESLQMLMCPDDFEPCSAAGSCDNATCQRISDPGKMTSNHGGRADDPNAGHLK